MDLNPLIKDGTLVPLTKGLTFPTSLSINSKAVKDGALFVAIPGTHHNGIIFIGEAIGRGACAIVAQGGDAKQLSDLQKHYPSVAFFETQDTRKAISLLASKFYPLQPNNIVAVTGTNGKTSVVSFIRQIWTYLGIPAASLGTLGLIIEGKPYPPPTGTGGINTPDAISLHEILQNLKKEHIEHMAFEASSHGLHQHRLDGVKLKAAVFTNLTNDHLDYHQTMESYFEAKSRLFKDLIDEKGYAVLNADIPEYKALASLCNNRGVSTISFGKAGKNIQLFSLIPHENEQELHLSVEGKSYHFTLPLVGEFQAYNVIAALGAVIACGGDIEKAIKACSYLTGVPGRLERIAPGVYIDYAHTPDGLLVALKALRPHTLGKLWVVFGCGGNRDALKRPMMGKIAEELADKIIITDDNPRFENPAEIRKQVLEKCPRALEATTRRQAIQMAVEGRESNDIVLIAGKGHETYQIEGDQAVPFNDSEEILKFLKP